MWETCANQCDDPSKVVEAGCDAQLNGRMGTLEEMGKICLFLAADATFCTGIGNVSAIASLSVNSSRSVDASRVLVLRHILMNRWRKSLIDRWTQSLMDR